MKHENLLARWLEHIQVLAGDIGPRGSTTEGERRAHAYAEQVFRRLGYQPCVETFQSGTSAFQVFIVISALMLGAFIAHLIGGIGGDIAAAVLAVLSIFCVSREMTFRSNPARFLIRKGQSQNVYTVQEPAEEHQRDLVLIGHVDTLRTPFFFEKRILVDAWRIFTTMTISTFMVAAATYIIGIFIQWPLTFVSGAISATFAVLFVAVCIHADNTPYTAGANDNASGSGLVLALAEWLQTEPLRNTRVWLLVSGCEEVKHYGAIDFFRRHTAELHNPAALVFEMLGIAGPAWLTREGVTYPFMTKASAELIALCEKVSAQLPELGASASQVHGGNTEMADAIRYGVPAITLIGITTPAIKLGYAGEELYWHRRSDTPDKMQPEVMARTLAFIRAVIQSYDTDPD